MMRRALYLLASVVLALSYPATAWADSRAHGTAGAGVANGHTSQASFLNPALLAYRENRELVLPSFTLELSDQDSLLNRLDEFQATWQELEEIVSDIDEGSPIEPDRIEKLTSELAQRYSELRGEASIDGDIYSMVSLPQQRFPLSLFVRASGDVMTGTRLDPEDPQRIEDFLANDLRADLASRAFVFGFLRTDFGLTAADQWELWGGQLAFGASLLVQRLDTFVYVAEVADFEERAFDTNEHRTTDVAPNLDLGMQWQHGAWQIGLTARHLNSREVVADTPEVRLPGVEPVQPRYQFRPAYQLGLGYQHHNVRLALDVDLVARDYLALDTASQRAAYDETRAYRWLRLGTEWQQGLMSWQTGVRYDLAGSRPAAATVGAAREFFPGFTLALNTLINEENALGLGGQLHFSF